MADNNNAAAAAASASDSDSGDAAPPTSYAVNEKSTVESLKQFLGAGGTRVAVSVCLGDEELEDARALADLTGSAVQVTYDDKSTAAVVLGAENAPGCGKGGCCCPGA
ncbi:hypothetical protein H4R18_003324 [Coemansia javaensis]|uniref:Uncharacterized protein n=1 Tax=Coemansia javaensis TaxID=2761396 RepID=A0A9W8LGH9_9FUNG|nr:hypothetical protein H4R18_003324 [Coemansia javaensis]